MLKTAVILAGGEGTRLKPYTEGTPKPLVEVAGKPIMYWTLQWLKSYGVEHAVLAVADKREHFEKFLQKYDLRLKVDLSENTKEHGTAGAFKLAIERFVDDEDFLAMNGDELTNMDLTRMVSKHKLLKPYVTMALVPFQCRFSVINMRYDDKIMSFDYGPKLPQVPVSIGIYLFNSELRKYLPDSGSIETLVFTKLAKEERMVGHMLTSGEEWATVNDVKELKEAEEKIKKWAVYGLNRSS